MIDGAFRSILQSGLPPSTLQQSFSLRFEHGNGVLLGLANLFAEVAQAQLKCSALMKEAAARSDHQLRQLRNRPHASVTSTSIWDAAISFVVQQSKALDQAAALNQTNVVDQLRHVTSSYENVRDQFFVVAATMAVSPEPSGNKSTRRLKRAEAKYNLALEELGTAQKSRDELVARFGKELKPELLAKATDRVKRALILKTQAESELGQYSNVIGDKKSVSTGTTGEEVQLPLTKETMKILETAERARTQVLREATKTVVRTSFMAVCATCSPLLALAQAVESYSPSFDITSWLAKMMNVQVAVESTDLVSCLSNPEKSWLMKQGNDQDVSNKALMDQTAATQSIKNLLKQREQLLKILQDENSLLKEEISLLKSQQVGFPQGASVRSTQESEPRKPGSISNVASPPAAGTLSPSTPLLETKSPGDHLAKSESRRAVRLSTGMPEEVESSVAIEMPRHSESQTPKRRNSSSVKPVEKASLLRRMATALKGGPSFPPGPEEEDDDLASMAEQKARESFIREEESDEFKVSDFIPPLRERLKPDLPPEATTLDKLIEIERRFEEYMWSMRNLHFANVIRNLNWDCEGYIKGLDVEYGFQTYTSKLPRNISLSSEIYVDLPDALEWSAPSMTARDWSLFAYETLLIVYHSMAQALIAREIAKLPSQDIQEIKLADFVAARPEKNELRAAEDRAGGRHRRYSLLPPDVEADRLSVKSPLVPGKVVEESSETMTASLLEANATMLRNLIRTWRVHLKLAAADNSLLTSLILPSGLEFGEEGYALGYSFLDVRYRVCRLHASWVIATQDIENQRVERYVRQPVAAAWIFRQLHFVRISILMKVVRMSRFLPQLKNIYKWLNNWTSKTNWHQIIASCIPAPETEDDRFLKGNFSQLVECLKLSLIVLADFFGALQADQWGLNIYRDKSAPIESQFMESEITIQEPAAGLEPRGDDSTQDSAERKVENNVGYGYRNAEGFLRLVALMSCVAGVDKCIRYIVAENEKALIPGGHFETAITRNMSDSSDISSDGDDVNTNPQDAGRVLFGENWKGAVADFDLSAVLGANAVDTYWQYELPIQHLVTSELCRLVCDGQSPNKMVVDAPTVMQAIIISAHVIQHGYDPTLWTSLRVSQVLMSLDTFALYFIKALWDECVQNAERKANVRDEFDVNLDLVGETVADQIGETGDFGADSVDSADRSLVRCIVPANLMLSREILTTMNVIVTNFGNWLARSAAAMVLPKGPVAEEATTVSGGQADLTAPPSVPEPNIIEIRLIRLLENTPPDLFDSLEKPRGEYRRGQGPSSASLCGRAEGGGNLHQRQLVANKHIKFTHSNDPDFCVLDLPVLNEVADKPNFFDQIEAFRDEPEGVSLVLPSRVERVMTELCLRRLVSDKFRNELFSTLCNYRVHYETETLPIAIQLWERINDVLVLTPYKVPPAPPDVNHFNVLAPLPSILAGPIAQYDTYRYMIVQTIRNMFDRLFKEALTTLHNPSEDDAWFLPRIIDLDEEPESERVEIERAWSRVIKKFADGCQSFLAELRAELIHYTPVWTQFLPGNQHALICMHAAEDRLRLMFDGLTNSPFWPEEDLPPNSAPIVAAFAHFDRLVKEIRIGSRFEQLLAEVEPLSGPLAFSAATALNKKLRVIESILDRCIKAETWKPINPPESLYSVTAVDYFQFVHHILEAVWEFNAAPEWLLPIIIQFLGRLTRHFSDFVKTSTAEPRLAQIAVRCQTTFKHLLSPIPRVDVSLLSQLIGGGKDRRRKKGLGGMMAFVGIGGKKSKRKDLAHQLQALQKQPDEEEDFVSPKAAEVDSGEDFAGVVSENDMSAESDEESGHTSKKKKKSKKSPEAAVAEEAAEITDELKELAAKIGPVLAVQLTKVSVAIGPSPLPTWLTRLHNLQYFSTQLPIVAQKVISVALDQAASEDPQHSEILKALEKAGGRKAVFYDKQDRLDEDTKKRFSDWQVQLEGAIEQCRAVLTQKSKEVCLFTALRVVYHDLCCDLFEDLYSPSFASANMANIIASLDHTVLKLVHAAPQNARLDVLRCIFHELVKAWAMVITEMGYMGHVFSPEDLNVVDSDLEAVRQFATQHMIDPDMELMDLSAEKGAGKDAPSQRINIFDYMSEFIVFLGTQPLLLAQLGGNYQPEKKKIANQPLIPVTSPTAPNDVANLFADMGADIAPAFDAKDILGAKKKKKGAFGGVLKAVGWKSITKQA